jgi:hypothetical protein
MSKITVEYLKEEANSEHTFFTEFALAYNKETRNLYCFYEGHDDPKYYSIRIRNITDNNNCLGFYCAGKNNVINAFKLISQKSEYNLNRILFFIDKDFSEIEEEKNIYCTPVYSIENFYTNENALENIIVDEFRIKKITNGKPDKDYTKIFKLYNSLLKKFHLSTRYFNVWLACQNDIRIEKNETKRLNIDNNVKEYFRNIVSPDLKSISDFADLNDLTKIESLFPEAYKIDEKQIKMKLITFKKLDGSKYFRGKFELKFMISFLDRIKNELGVKKSRIFNKKYKINLALEYSSSISLLSQYAITPECLKKYLEIIKNAA